MIISDDRYNEHRPRFYTASITLKKKKKNQHNAKICCYTLRPSIIAKFYQNDPFFFLLLWIYKLGFQTKPLRTQ